MKKIITVLAIVVCLEIFQVAYVSAEDEYKMCADGSLSVSVSCKEDDEITMKCNQEDVFSYQYSGYTSISLGAYSSYSKNYTINIKKEGTYEVEIDKNGILIGKRDITVFEKHNYGEEKITKKPTCTQDGKLEYECINCGNKKTETISKLGHNYGEEKITKKPTCTQDGKLEYECINCGNKKTETISKLGHDFGDYTVIKAATCKEEGYKSRKCSRCGGISGRIIIKKSDHILSDQLTLDEMPDCFRPGSQSYHCVVCNARFNEIDIKPLGHDFGEPECVREATIFKKAKFIAKCNRCSEEKIVYGIKLKAKVKLKSKKIKLVKGKSAKIGIKTKNDEDRVKCWKTSNKKILSINKKNGKIYAKRQGKAIVTLLMKSGCKAKCKILVTQTSHT